MAYPYSSLPANKTDASAATPNAHANDHNAVESALNDLLTELGGGPKGGAGSLTARLTALDALVALKAALAGATFTGKVTSGHGLALTGDDATVLNGLRALGFILPPTNDEEVLGLVFKTPDDTWGVGQDYAEGNFLAALSDADNFVTTPTSILKTISATTNATPVAVTTSTAHGYSTGDVVRITGTGIGALDGKWWKITVTDATHFTLNTSTAPGSTSAVGYAFTDRSPVLFRLSTDGPGIANSLHLLAGGRGRAGAAVPTQGMWLEMAADLIGQLISGPTTSQSGAAPTQDYWGVQDRWNGAARLIARVEANGTLTVRPSIPRASTDAILRLRDDTDAVDQWKVLKNGSAVSVNNVVAFSGDAKQATIGSIFGAGGIGAGSASDTILIRNAAGIWQVGNLFDFPEVSDPTSPAADHLRVYVKDDSGKTRVATKDSTGAVELLAPLLAATGLKTANYTLGNNEIAKADTSGGAFAFTLPTAPPDKTREDIILVTAGNTLTVNCGGSDVFNKAGGTTSKPLDSAGQVLRLQYQATGAIWIVLGDALLSLADSTTVTIDTSTAGQAKPTVTPNLTLTSLKLASGAVLAEVNYATFAALPASTYSNGTLGVGATLTGTANGALATQDGITPVVNDIILVKAQASAFQNGVYQVTTLGTAGTPFVLTRVTYLDEAADFANGVWLLVNKGTMHAGRIFQLKGGTYTVGTTPLIFDFPITMGDVLFGANRTRKVYDDDFDTFDAATTSGRLVGSKFFVTVTGAGAQVTQTENSDAVLGSADLSTGTTTTGACALTGGASGTAFDINGEWDLFARKKTPTASDGTQTFSWKVGFMDTNDGAPTRGVYFQGRFNVTLQNVECVVRTGGSETVFDSGVAQNTVFQPLQIKVLGNGDILFYVAGNLVITANSGNTGNIPSGSVAPVAVILKSAGTTARSLRLDEFSVNMPNARANVYAV